MKKFEKNLLNLHSSSVKSLKESLPQCLNMLQEIKEGKPAKLSKNELKKQSENIDKAILLMQQRLLKASELLHKKFHFKENIGKIKELAEQIEKEPRLNTNPNQTLQEVMGFENQLLEDFYQFASDLFYNKKISDASDVFYYLTTLNPYVPTFWQALATTEEVQKRFESAMSSYAMMTLLDASDFTPALNVANCLIKLNQQQEAKKFLHQMIEEAKKEKGHRAFISKASKMIQNL